jgi:hypothetical protein
MMRKPLQNNSWGTGELVSENPQRVAESEPKVVHAALIALQPPLRMVKIPETV